MKPFTEWRISQSYRVKLRKAFEFSLFFQITSPATLFSLTNRKKAAILKVTSWDIWLSRNVVRPALPKDCNRSRQCFSSSQVTSPEAVFPFWENHILLKERQSSSSLKWSFHVTNCGFLCCELERSLPSCLCSSNRQMVQNLKSYAIL